MSLKPATRKSGNQTSSAQHFKFYDCSALREIDSGTGVALPPALMKVTYAIQRPSVFVARLFYLYTNSRGLVVDNLFFGISVGGYHLILVCLLSFSQWFIVGLLYDAIVMGIKKSDQVSRE